MQSVANLQMQTCFLYQWGIVLNLIYDKIQSHYSMLIDFLIHEVCDTDIYALIVSSMKYNITLLATAANSTHARRRSEMLS